MLILSILPSLLLFAALWVAGILAYLWALGKAHTLRGRAAFAALAWLLYLACHAGIMSLIDPSGDLTSRLIWLPSPVLALSAIVAVSSWEMAGEEP